MASRKFKYQRREDSKAAEHCCVPLCAASSRFNSVLSFHTFPTDEEKRGKWIHNIRREKLNITSHTRVCSRHFISDFLIEPSTPSGRRLLRKGAVPTLFTWNGFSVAEPEQKDVYNQDDENPVPVEVHHVEHDYCAVPKPAAADNAQDQTEELRKEVERLRRQVEELSMSQRFCLGRFAASDDDIRFYTRFLTHSHLMAFWKLIEPASHNMIHVSRVRATTMKSEAGTIGSALGQPLQPIDEFFLFMVYLSLGLEQRDLAHRFNVHESTVSRIITTWANFLYTILGSVRIWMSEEAVKAHLPIEFQDNPDTQVVMDCTELRCQTQTSLLLQSEVFSAYTSHCTFKGLIGMAPHGAITFVSSLYADSVTDKELFEQSGIVSLLKPGMAIMVDRGFLVDDCVPCKVYRIAYLSKREHMSADEVRETQSMARLMVHVERLIDRVKQNKLFDTVIPLSITGSINELYTVACLLVNYQNGPLVKALVKD
ncbi:uncharacterized protein LOC130565305 [Triplophysa rosa]|uniref:THAP-type domain-containing protein n=1 Tax=Triplophysa rosa TaxID=992332 RepID=A0A9W7WIC7_TRIRA|nr:uncharacterized protein LOC130565305 [Triplophysa rosa]KAI7800509.1 hypothetical protein IRJ41_004896 [Triplophysa rosa]